MDSYAVHVPLALDNRFQANYPGVDSIEKMYASMVEGMDKSLGTSARNSNSSAWRRPRSS